MTNIALLGDTHGQTSWITGILKSLGALGVTKVIQLGDFGISNTTSGHLFLKSVRLALKEHGMTLYVVPGNHEDYDYIESIPVGEDGWQELRKGIFLAPRGHRWQWEETSFVALGGAPSVDRSYRLQHQRGGNKLWWAQEAITEEDVQNVIEGGYADVMVAHDAPYCNTIEARIAGNPQGFSTADIAYAKAGRDLMERAFAGVAPEMFFHGHYHFPVNDSRWFTSVDDSEGFEDIRYHQARIIGLDCDSKIGSLVLFDTETKNIQYLDALRMWGLSTQLTT